MTYSFTAVGPQTVSLSQTIVSTGHIKQMEASVMVKVRTRAQTPPAVVEKRRVVPPCSTAVFLLSCAIPKSGQFMKKTPRRRMLYFCMYAVAKIHHVLGRKQLRSRPMKGPILYEAEPRSKRHASAGGGSSLLTAVQT